MDAPLKPLTPKQADRIAAAMRELAAALADAGLVEAAPGLTPEQMLRHYEATPESNPFED